MEYMKIKNLVQAKTKIMSNNLKNLVMIKIIKMMFKQTLKKRKKKIKIIKIILKQSLL